MRLVFLLTAFMLLHKQAHSQSDLKQSNTVSAGGAKSENATQRLYSVIGQPIFINNTNRSQTQAGFMQVADYIITDAIAPVISYSGGAMKINKQSPPTFTATITDNISVTSAKIFYRRLSEASWNSANLTKNANDYSVTVQPAWFDAMGMEYYFVASDATPNTKRDPATASYYAYTTSNEETVNGDHIGFGTEMSSYKIIAMPYSTLNNSVTSLFEEFGAYSNTKWRMASYNNATDSFDEYPDFTALARGVGYWILVKTPTDVKIGPVEAPANNRSSLYTMTLKPGWNMIGNPYPVAINWSAVRTLNANSNIGEIHVYNRGFTNGENIAAYQGGFVFVNGNADIQIKIPFSGQTSEGGRIMSEFSNNIGSEKWSLKLSASQGNSNYQLGGFGMHPTASLKADQFDDYNPPSFMTSPEINFPHPEHKLGSFCRDVVPTASEAVWSFTANGKVDEHMTLSWNPDLGRNNKELFLVDESNLNVVDFKAVNRYSFVLEKDHHFKIYYGESVRDKLLPVSVVLLPPYPNPISKTERPTFKLGLPDNVGAYSLEISVTTSTGILVGSFFSKAMLPGIHEISIDLNDQQLASGMLYYRVRVNTGQFGKVFTGKLIVL